MSEPLKLIVHTYSGHKADERPTHFEWMGIHYTVEAVLDRWYGPDYMYFRVRASNGAVYVLKHDEREDVWTIETAG